MRAFDLQLRPILSSLRHHKLTAMLLILQVALTCAIVCNVGFMIVQRMQQVSLPSGVDEAGLSMLVSEAVDKRENKLARHAADLAGLRTIPGVTAAVAVDTLPLGRDESSYGTCASAEVMAAAIAAHSMMRGGLCMQPAVFGGTPGEVGILGLHLIAGRDFRADEYVAGADEHIAGQDVAVVILSRVLAEKLYPGKNALGQSVYTGGSAPIRVIGIVDTLLRPRLRDAAVNQYTMLFPMLPNDGAVTYLLRSAPQDRQRVMKAAAAKLVQLSPERIIPPDSIRTYTRMRDGYFQHDTTMIGLLLVSALGLLFVTALGITGLANFWVQQRTRSIGIRRAIGARRIDILRYFQTENFLIVSAGVVLGAVLALTLNLLLMRQYEVSRLPLFWLPIGALGMWMLGQLAVLSPALRAASVPPVVATSSV